MTAPQPVDELAAVLLAERFPPPRVVRREATRRPLPLVRPVPAALVDDELTIARRRRVLCDALDTVHHDHAYTA